MKLSLFLCILLLAFPVFAEAPPAPKPTGYSQDSIEYTINYFFSKYGDSVVSEAIKIATCESRLKADAFNASDANGGSVGVFQINMIHGFPKDYLFIPYNNIKEAEKLYSKQGWSPWSCKRVLASYN